MSGHDPFTLLLEHLDTMILEGQAWEARALFMDHVAPFVVSLAQCTRQVSGIPGTPLDIESIW